MEELPMLRSLENSTAVVTGASSGIGYATSLALARCKARVALVGRRLPILKDLATKCGPRASAYSCDLTDDEMVAKFAAKLSVDFPSIDILVHSSGTIKLGRIQTSPVSDFDAQYSANVRGPYLLTQSLLPQLQSVSGQVVFINSSITRAANIEGRGSYAATQQAVQSIANALRDEVNAAGIRVTTIFPGTTATERQVQLHRMSGKTYDPNRMLKAEDVAEAVLFALSIGRSAEITDIYLRPMLKPLV
jgi:NADP-dependent 3-hydroxy acid dehydrogenase YdfG